MMESEDSVLRQIADACRPIVDALEQVGIETNWAGGDETDRVYPWYEIKPLSELLERLEEVRAHAAAHCCGCDMPRAECVCDVQ